MPPAELLTVTLFTRLPRLTTPEPVVPEFCVAPPAPGHWLPALLGVAAPTPPPIDDGLILAKPDGSAAKLRAQLVLPVVPRLTCELSLTSTPRPLLALRRLSATSAPAPRVTATP